MGFGLMLFAFIIILQPLGQILEKAGMNKIEQITSIGQLFHPDTLLQIITNYYVIGGITLSAISLFLWLGVLSNMEVSYIYPFGAISYIVLAILAYFILREEISAVNWAGIGIIVIGCFLINK